MTPHDRTSELATQAVIASPSVAAIVAAKILELRINDWLGLLGIVFLLIQAAAFIWRWRRDIRIERERQAHSRLLATTQPEDQ